MVDPFPLLSRLEIASSCRSLPAVTPACYQQSGCGLGDEVMLFPSMVYGAPDLVAIVHPFEAEPKNSCFEIDPAWFGTRARDVRMYRPAQFDVSVLGHLSSFHIVGACKDTRARMPLDAFLLGWCNRRKGSLRFWRPTVGYVVEVEPVDLYSHPIDIMEKQIEYHLRSRVEPGQDFEVRLSCNLGTPRRVMLKAVGYD